MNTDRKAKFFIFFILNIFLAIRFLQNWGEIDVLRQFLPQLSRVHLILDGQIRNQDSFVMLIVYIEVLLPLIGEDRVELKEVLPPERARAE